MTEVAAGAAAILGFDPFDPDFHADPYAHYRRLSAEGPLLQTQAGLWVATAHDVCSQVLRDPRFGHRPEGGGGFWRAEEVGETEVAQRSFLTLDPPDHTRLRRLVSKAFTARLVERLRPRISALVDELLADVSGDVDLIETLAYPLPVTLISELLGVPPEDEGRFRAWSDALARGLDPDFILPPAEAEQRIKARVEFAGYFRELAARRREQPGDDLLSALVAVSDEGDVLSEAELLATCILLLVAGHETTVNLIGNGALALLRHPDQLSWFRAHPEAAPAAIEELLRYDPPVQLTGRTALEDVEVAGHQIARGQMILLLTGSANRDPAVFADSDRLDLTRWLEQRADERAERSATPRTERANRQSEPAAKTSEKGSATKSAERHLAFGLGIHFCLGAPLARLEGEIALTKLFERDVNLAGDVSYRDNLILRGLASLPVTLV